MKTLQIARVLFVVASGVGRADFRSLAGTGQVIAFGRWDVSMGELEMNGGYYYLHNPATGQTEKMRVYGSSAVGVKPATYFTNSGIVKLDGPALSFVSEPLKKALTQR